MATKTAKSAESRFKHIIKSFWFWMLIALISYILFVSMPIKWSESGYGWNAWEGINLYKTIFGYINALAFLVAVILIIISITNYIQKSSIGDYWKISLTIIGIIVIIVFAYFYIKQYIPAQSSDTGNYALENYNQLVKEDLSERYGYEVISVGMISEPMKEYNGLAYINMKSLGSRSEQIWNGLMALATYSEIAGYNLSSYSITILAPTNECSYYIKGESWRAYMDYIKKPQYDIYVSMQLKNNIDYEMNNTKSCS